MLKVCVCTVCDSDGNGQTVQKERRFLLSRKYERLGNVGVHTCANFTKGANICVRKFWYWLLYWQSRLALFVALDVQEQIQVKRLVKQTLQVAQVQKMQMLAIMFSTDLMNKTTILQTEMKILNGLCLPRKIIESL